MKHLLTALTILAFIAPCHAESQQEDKTEATESISPEAIVDAQIAAYNRGDIEAFIGTFAQDVKVYSHPNNLLIPGIQNLKEEYTEHFNAHPAAHAEVISRITQGNLVIYHVFVTGVVGREYFFATAIYEVHDAKIQNIWFLQ